MDNITHSLVGFAIAKYVNYKNEPKLKQIKTDSTVKYFFIFISVFAANFPDLDLIYSLYDPSRLGYLVHHRGYTHTFLFVLPQALLTLFVSALIFKIKDKIILISGFGLIFVNLILHIFLDSLNVYGVHPFFPWDNNWYYGDKVFIIEPLIWYSLLPLLLAPINKLVSFKSLLVIIFLLPLLYAVQIQMLSVGNLVVLSLYFLLMLILFNQIFESFRIYISIGLATILFLSFIVEGSVVKSRIRNNFLVSVKKNRKLIDLAISPYPGNPLCWSVLVIQILSNNRYEVAIGQYQSRSILGFSCPAVKNKINKTPDMALRIQKDDFYRLKNHIKWIDIKSAPKNKIFKDFTDCHLHNWFQFARVPYIYSSGNYADLRFSIRSNKDNFTLMNLKDNSASCSKKPAPWIYPRKDLLETQL